MTMWVLCYKAEANRAEFVPRSLGVYKWNRKGQPLVLVRTKAEQKKEAKSE